MEQQPDSKRLEILLKEYEVSQAYSSHKETQVWQTASIFIALSLAGIALLGGTLEPGWSRLALLSIIGLASVVILRNWGRILRRWTSYDRITLYRMREIETELGMWKNRYIADLDHYKSTGAHVQAYLDSSPDAETRLDRLVDRYAEAHSTKAGGPAVARIRQMLVLAWVLIVVVEFVFTLLHSAGITGIL